jgi:hypothetical protein
MFSLVRITEEQIINVAARFNCRGAKPKAAKMRKNRGGKAIFYMAVVVRSAQWSATII